MRTVIYSICFYVGNKNKNNKKKILNSIDKVESLFYIITLSYKKI